MKQKLKPWEIVLLVVVGGIIIGVGVSLLTGCVTVPVAPLPDGTPSGETALVPGWSSATAATVASFLPPPWGEIATALAGAVAVPLLGAAGSPRVRQALKKGKITTALGWKHSTPSPGA